MPATRTHKPPHLRVEPLEAREVPAVVTATNDLDDYLSTNPTNWAGPNGQLSLPEAIREVNAEGGGSIDFAVDHVTLTQPLAAITVPVTITGLFNGGAPGTAINGAGLAGGITLGNNATVRDLVVQNFGGAYGMSIAGAADVQNCFFGTTADGLAAAGNAGAGLVIKSGTVENCLFAGNGGDGLRVTGTATVANDLFGTDATGLALLANREDGVVLTGPNSVVRNNVLAGSGANGVSVEGALAAGNKVIGNKIGVALDGATAVPNGVGVFIGSGARNTVVGGTASADRNVISGNTGDGVRLERAGITNSILGNWIGVGGPAGTAATPNGGNGVFVHITGSTTVGGTLAGSRNVIAGNAGAGVRIDGVPGQLPATRANKVLGNWIGLDANGAAKGNTGGGVVIAGGAAANTVGGTLAAAANVISGNGVAGVELTDAGTTNNVVLGNFIGTDATGTAARPNEYGVEIAGGALTNTIGGALAGSRNLISGNSKAGVYIVTSTITPTQATRANRVVGNYIGTTADGATALGNVQEGVRIDGALRNVIGGLGPAARNVISGNGADGVAITGVAGDLQQNVVSGNYIGVDATGAVALGNLGAGVSVAGGDKNRVGGTTAGERNVISGNAREGVDVRAGATGTWVLGNYVGTDPTGKVAVPNQLGIHVEAGNTLTVLGGLFRGYGNVVSGNNGDGVRLESTTIVRNNLIGTDRAGTVPVGNLGYGIESFADGTSVGGAGVGNVIANSQLDGVLVSGGIHNTISSNRIFDNRGLGIRLVNGGNMGVQPGSIFAQYTTAVTVRGQVAGLAGQSVRVELYADQAGQVDPSGQGEGALFVAGANAIKFDQFGNYSVTFKRLLPAGYNYVCITLTGPDGDTSAFSFVFQVR